MLFEIWATMFNKQWQMRWKDKLVPSKKINAQTVPEYRDAHFLSLPGPAGCGTKHHLN